MSELLRSTLGKGIEIETVLAGDLWRVFVDANQRESALLNLAVNARDAMPAGGKLRIETGNTYLDEAYAVAHPELTPGQYVMLAVIDTGTGMSDETVARAAEPFFTTKPVGEGTGLGLSQVYGFVGQSKGHIKISSELGVRTTVEIYFPRYVGAEELAVRTPTIPEIAPNDATVLVVEDNGDVREYIISALARLGYRALEAGGATPALTVIEHHPAGNLLPTQVGVHSLHRRRAAGRGKQTARRALVA